MTRSSAPRCASIRSASARPRYPSGAVSTIDAGIAQLVGDGARRGILVAHQQRGAAGEALVAVPARHAFGRELEGELAADTERAFHRQRAAHQDGILPAQREAEAETLHDRHSPGRGRA